MGIYVFDWGAQMGVRPEKDTVENQFAWGRKELGIQFGIQLDGGTRDTGNTPPTVLRPGLALGKIVATKFYGAYNPANTDGTQILAGFLAGPAMRMVDIDGNNQAKSIAMIVSGPVQAALLFGLDTMARAQAFGRFLFDDDQVGNNFGWKNVSPQSANYIVLSTDNGTRFIVPNTASGPVTFILPNPVIQGWKGQFYNEANQNMVISGQAGQLVGPNGYAFTTCTFSTASQKIGSCVEVFANELADHWIVVPLSPNTATFA